MLVPPSAPGRPGRDRASCWPPTARSRGRPASRARPTSPAGGPVLPARPRVFDAAFEVTSGRPLPEAQQLLADLGPRPAQAARPAPAAPAADDDARPRARARAGGVVRRRAAQDKDFARYTDAERALARRLVLRSAVRGPTRLSRRTRATRRRGDHADHRARCARRCATAASRSSGAGASPAPAAAARARRRRVGLDGALRAHTPHLRPCARGRPPPGRGLRLRDPADPADPRARPAATPTPPSSARPRRSTDWDGGTRIGAALSELNRVHGRRIGRGSVVVVLSDGWDRGDPEELAAEMARLSRCAHRLVWLNPLKSQPGYEPLTRGMVAALPHVDAFLAGYSMPRWRSWPT